MMKRILFIGAVLAATAGPTQAQVVLAGTSYTQNFDSIGSGLPTGWSVTTDSSISTLGTTETFTTDPVSWASTASSGIFRNSSSSNITFTTTGATQEANSDRAIGWRPSTAAQRDGAITVQISNTVGFENFSLGVSVFTGNDVTAASDYALEFRVGESGNFTQIGSTYSTGTPYSQTTFSISSVTLSALNNQSEAVYFRLRGTTPTGTGSLDTVGFDNFNLTFSAVPEPASFALLAGLGFLGLAATRRPGRPFSV